MTDGPKLYTHKPKKGQLKGKDFSTPAPNPSAMGPTPPPPPPPPPKESFARRYKFLWPLLLTVNLAIGGYLFMRTKKKDTGEVAEEIAKKAPAPATSATASVPEKASPTPTITEPVKVHPPITEAEQRELFKWILEERRKVKPRDPSEKKQIDEEKAILKQYIRAKSIPNF